MCLFVGLIDWWLIDYPDLLPLISCVITNALGFRYYRHWTYLPSGKTITWTIWGLHLCRVSDIPLPATKYLNTSQNFTQVSMLGSEGPPVASEVWRINYLQLETEQLVLHWTSSCPLYDRLTIGTYSLQTSGLCPDFLKLLWGLLVSFWVKAKWRST